MTQQTSPLKDIEILVQSHFGLICIDSAEHSRIDTLMRHVADSQNLPYYTWSATKGLRRLGLNGAVYQTNDLMQALGHLENATSPGIYFFEGLGSHLSSIESLRSQGPVSHDDRSLIQRIKDVVELLAKTRGGIVMNGEHLALPPELDPYATRVSLPAPNETDFRDLLIHLIRDMSIRKQVPVQMNKEEGQRLLNNLKGLTLMEARKILTRIILEKGILAPDSISAVQEAKKSIVQEDGLLEYYPVEESLAGVAGLNGLKAWLAKRKDIVTNPSRAVSFGLSFPKGILLLGVQGCGKSLCAKAVAMEWQLPLLKLDPSTLYNKYIGETEKNFNRAVSVAERMAPVILWIDEIEKAFSSAGSDQDGGVSQRLFGSFLGWMQDRRADVFVIATANAIEKLPPEFLRKGRFDEIFFVDLPDAAARQAVFEIHLKKRGREAAKFDLISLVRQSDGFSGAEIEQVVVSGLYTAFASNGELTTDILLNEIKATRPLSQTMSEKVQSLREWARERTVPAN